MGRMMADSTITEQTGRAAIDRVLEGVTETQRQVGMVPGGSDAEAFARDVVERQIKIHEEQLTRESTAPDAAESCANESPARLDRGDIPDDASVIDNTLDAAPAQMTPQAQRHMFGPRLPLLDQLMLARLNMLRQFPEWDARIQAAWVGGEQAAMLSGSELERTDAYRRHLKQSEEVIKVIDESSAIFGDWRRPRTDGRTKIIMVPLGT